MDGAKPTAPPPGGSPKDELLVIASDVLSLSGDVPRLVTFLNRSLKDDGYIFGLRRADGEGYRLTIYRA